MRLHQRNCKQLNSQTLVIEDFRQKSLKITEQWKCHKMWEKRINHRVGSSTPSNSHVFNNLWSSQCFLTLFYAWSCLVVPQKWPSANWRHKEFSHMSPSDALDVPWHAQFNLKRAFLTASFLLFLDGNVTTSCWTCQKETFPSALF